MASTTIELDTELSAVNSILGSIGQSPVTKLDYNNPEVSFIYNILNEVNKDVQNEGWHFNTETHLEVQPDSTTNEIAVPSNVIRYDLHDGLVDKTMDTVIRNGKLYDLVLHSYEFKNEKYYVDAVTLIPFNDVPNAFQRYITYKASVRAATQLVTNTNLVTLLQQQEAAARATCMEYECRMADYSFFGVPHESGYNSFQPFKSLVR